MAIWVSIDIHAYDLNHALYMIFVHKYVRSIYLYMYISEFMHLLFAINIRHMASCPIALGYLPERRIRHSFMQQTIA